MNVPDLLPIFRKTSHNRQTALHGFRLPIQNIEQGIPSMRCPATAGQA